MRQQRPYHARVLVRQRTVRHALVTPRDQPPEQYRLGSCAPNLWIEILPTTGILPRSIAIWARRTSPTLGGAIHRAATAGRACRCAGAHEASAQDATGAQALRLAQADSRTGVRHHQVGNALPAVPVAWLGERARGVEAGDNGMEYQKYGDYDGINERAGVHVPFFRHHRTGISRILCRARFS